MVSTKTLLKGAGILIAALVLIRLALWILGVVVSTVIWAIQTALVLLFVGLLLYGLYWGYNTLTADNSGSETSREKLYER